MQAVTYGGNLASVSSDDENAKLVALGDGLPARAWFGLMDQANEGGYVWSDGRPFCYENWDNGEPNNLGGGEDCVELFAGTDFPPGDLQRGKWNDLPCSQATERAAFYTIPVGVTVPGDFSCVPAY